MKSYVQPLCASLLAVACRGHTEYIQEECLRIRRPIHLLSNEDLLLYVEGMEGIRNNGKYQLMVDAHEIFATVHRGSSFFFYHSYFVWEVETQIRKLGSKFKCFSVPYYDWTIDAGREASPFVLNSVFGGDGDEAKADCITDSLWDIERWPLRELCDESEDADVGCCLKRRLYPDALLGNATTVGSAIEMPQFDDFRGVMAAFHHQVHALFGGGEASFCGRCAMSTGYSPDDPIFMILHSFLSYTRALWAACHSYDQIDPADLDEHPEAYTAECSPAYPECGVIELDDTYDFGDLKNTNWSLVSRMRVTPREMWDFVKWGVQFDHGTFVQTSGILETAQCDDKNVALSKWFAPEIDEDDDCFVEPESAADQVIAAEAVVSDDVTAAEGNEIVVPKHIMLAVAVLMALKAVCAIRSFSYAPFKEDRNQYISLSEEREPRDAYGSMV